MKTLTVLAGVVAIVSCVSGASSAWSAEFNAEVDRDRIDQDESVSLKLTVQMEGSGTVETPSFKAPDFEVIHQYQGQFAESFYENGRVGSRFMRSFTFVLRPNSTGKKSITDIQTKVDGQVMRAGNLSVEVAPGGAGAAPPRNYGGQGSGLRGSAKPSRSGDGVFVRAEVDKNAVFKGEQIIVSYYLFVRAQSYNAQPEKFPALNGFLKEEVDVPLIKGQLREEVVTLDGGVYKKILLARYAAYPLKAGKLAIDPMTLKVNYYAPRASDLGEEDDIFSTFFRQMTPRSALVKNDPVQIDVKDLPVEGRPEKFSGAVGDFSIIAAVNRYDVRANEPVNLTVKIEGRGNLSIVQAPKLDLPDGVQLFESRAQSKEGRGGTGERLFEYLLIPRREGEFVLPGVEFNYFDPETRTYVVKKSEPMTIRASPGDANLAPTLAAPTQTRDVPSPSKSLAKKLALAGDGWESSGRGWIRQLSDFLPRILLLISIIILGYLLVPLALGKVNQWRTRGRRAESRSKDWEKIRSAAQGAAKQSLSDVVKIYERIEARIYDGVERSYGIQIRALSRQEIREILVTEKNMSEDQWNQMKDLFDFVETVRFAHRAGAVSEERVRNELSGWIERAEKIENALKRERSE